MNLDIYAQLGADHGEDGCQVVHAGVAAGGEHAVQAFAGLGGLAGELLEAYSCVDQIAKDNASGFRLAIQEQGGRLVEEGLGKSGITLRTFCDGFFEATGESHDGLPLSFGRALAAFVLG